MRLSPWFVVPLLALPTVPTSAAPPKRTQLNQYEQVGRRFGLTPAQVAQVYEFVDRNATAINAAATKKRVNQVAFKAIARELGLRNFGADPKALLEATKANAANAAEFEKDNRELRKQVSALESAVVRTPAEAILARADAAYATGDLEKAQNELNSLLEPRGGELAGSVDAYLAAVDTMRTLARSRGDRAIIDHIGEQVEPILARMENQNRLARWRSRTEMARIRFEHGQRYGKMAELEEAANLYLTRALPLVPKSDYPVEWAATQISLGNVLLLQGERSAGEVGTALLARAVNAYEEAQTVYTITDFPTKWADSQNSLSNALSIQGERLASNTLLRRAVEVRDEALKIYKKADTPLEWASAQTNLGNTLSTLGKRSVGNAGFELLDRAVKAYENALTVRTKAYYPDDWALIQDYLGDTFRVQAERSSGEIRRRLLDQSINSFVEALTVNTEFKAPLQWANIQTNLGNTLLRQGEMTSGKTGHYFLTRSMFAFLSALRVINKTRTPFEWALIQTNLGSVLILLAGRSEREYGNLLLQEAIIAFENALTVRTNAVAPTDWASTQTALGNVLVALGERSPGDEGSMLLSRAISAYESALTVFTKVDAPVEWALIQTNLGTALTRQGERLVRNNPHNASGIALFDKAVVAFENTLIVRSKSDAPFDWANTKNNLGLALFSQAQLATYEKRASLLNRAIKAYEEALTIRTRADYPAEWANTQNNRASALVELGKLSIDEAGIALLENAVEIHRDVLSFYTKTDVPADWALTQNNLGNALLIQGERVGGDVGISLLTEAVKAYEESLTVRGNLPPPTWTAAESDASIRLPDSPESPASNHLLKRIAFIRAAKSDKGNISLYDNKSFSVSMKNLSITGSDKAIAGSLEFGSFVTAVNIRSSIKTSLEISDNADFLPWPPPTPSSMGNVSRNFRLVANQGGIESQVREKLSKYGHNDLRYFAVEGGFGITTKLERLNENGTISTKRWTRGKLGGFSGFWPYVMNAIYGEQGLYRISVFIVTNREFQPKTNQLATDENSQYWEKNGQRELSSLRRDQPVQKDTKVWMLVYEFRASRSKGRALKAIEIGKFPFKLHASAVGLR